MTPEAKVKAALDRLSGPDVNLLVAGEDDYKQIAEAVMAWYQMLSATGAIKRKRKFQREWASAFLILGALVKRAYALGRLAGYNKRGEQ